MKTQQTLQVCDSGSNPTHPQQFIIKEIPVKNAVDYNRLWHSRLPELGNYFSCCVAYGAYYESKVFAVGIFGRPVARHFNGLPILELRRMAICPDAPKNTASRMIRVMLLLLKKKYPKTEKVISYQDTSVHSGAIYKASGWKIGYIRDRGREKGWINRKGRVAQTKTGDRLNSIKIRWEYEYV